MTRSGRRRYQFRLWHLFVVTTVAAVLLGWLAVPEPPKPPKVTVEKYAYGAPIDEVYLAYCLQKERISEVFYDRAPFGSLDAWFPDYDYLALREGGRLHGEEKSVSGDACHEGGFEGGVSSNPGGDVHVGMDVGKGEILVVIRWSDGTFERPWRVKNPTKTSLLVALLVELARKRRTFAVTRRIGNT